MTNDLTIDTLSYKLTFSDKVAGSERRETSRGVNLPEVLTIKHQDYVDSGTKFPGTRSVVRLDRMMDLGNGVILPVSAYMVVTVPKSTGIVSSDVLAAVQRIVTVLQEDDSGLDLMDEIFVNREQ